MFFLQNVKKSIELRKKTSDLVTVDQLCHNSEI